MVAYGLACGLALVTAGFQVACHHRLAGPTNYTQPPVLSYQTPTILATAGEPFASVAPDVSAYVMVNDVASLVTSGFTFSVTPALPADLTLNRTTGVISGTPSATSAAVDYTLVASNTGGNSNGFVISLGVQASSPVSLSYLGAAATHSNINAVSTVVGAAMTLAPPVVTGATLTSTDGHGYGVSPALPAGLAVNLDTGTVSGTPTAAVAATAYTLTLTTANGSADAPFTLLVTAAAPTAPLDLSYGSGSSTTLSGTVNTPFTVTPTVSAGTYLVYNVSPALPAGLSLDATTGEILGTPTVATAAASYVITAGNAGGNSQATLILTIN
ncbi:MAG: putative Ig domain-containing protein [Holophaga sp.]|nr:putative Ig domain-containing protein [Holophaga sp.]